MKLYSGFTAKCKQMRYYPASPARGRPEGFWAETDREFTASYNMTTYWFGSEAGIILAKPDKMTANDLVMYGARPQFSWHGQQVKKTVEGKTVLEDIWLVEDATIQSLPTSYGYENVKVVEFRTSFNMYLKQAQPGLFVDRKEYREDLVEPTTDLPEETYPTLQAEI